MQKTDLAENLRRLRRTKGFATARHFSQVLGINENRYARYERGQAEPEVALILDICAKLGVSPNELFGWDHASAGSGPMGFAEGRPPPTSAPVAGERSHEPAGSQQVQNPLDRACWRLAATLALIEAPAASQSGPMIPSGSSALQQMRLSADLFLRLKKDPFAALAHILRSGNVERQSPDVEKRLAADIQSYLALLDAEPEQLAPHGR